MLRIIIACFTVCITSAAGTGKLQAIRIVSSNHNHNERGTFLHSTPNYLDGASSTAIRRELGKREEHRFRKNRNRQPASGSIVVKEEAINTDAQSKKEKKREQRLMNKKKEKKKNERNKQKMEKLKVSTKKTSSQRGAKSAKGSKAGGGNDSTPSKTARPTTSSSNGKSNKKPNPKSGKSQHGGGKSGKHVRVSKHPRLQINTNILEMIISHVKSLTNTIDSFH